MSFDKTAWEIAHELKLMMPSIGFLSKPKRIYAYIWTAERAYELAGEDKRIAAEALAILSLTYKPFQKAMMMTMLNKERISAGLLAGFPYELVHGRAVHEGLVR